MAFDPFILYALKKYTPEDQDEVFTNLECYVMRQYVIGNTGAMGSFLSDAEKMIEGTFNFNKALAAAAISDYKLEKALKNITPTKARLSLFWIELKRHTDPKSDLYESRMSYIYELEHIMPQKWEEYWSLDALPILDDEGNPVASEIGKRERENAITEIGNMTLLTPGMNKKLRNYCFYDKVKGKKLNRKQQDGMAEFASLSITKEVIKPDIDEDGNEVYVWNEDKIHARTQRMIEAFKEIWPYRNNIENDAVSE